jgi:hypothetical protein
MLSLLSNALKVNLPILPKPLIATLVFVIDIVLIVNYCGKAKLQYLSLKAIKKVRI